MCLIFFLLIPRPPRSPLFPYTTLFRSCRPPPTRRAHRPSGSLILAHWRFRHDKGAYCRDDRTPQLGSKFSRVRSEEHTSELQSHSDLVCRLLLEKKKVCATSAARSSVE